MLLRQCWEMSSEEALDMIDADPWALLISNGQEVPLITATPLLLDRRGERGTLIGHIARANPQAVSVGDGARVLALFQGPRAYVSPSWYPARNMAPTMYHVLVEAEGIITLHDTETMGHWIERLTRRYEARNADQWTMQELSEAGIARRMQAIVGFEIRITALRGKAKLGQDEPQIDALAVASNLAVSDAKDDRRLAEWVKEKNS